MGTFSLSFELMALVMISAVAGHKTPNIYCSLQHAVVSTKNHIFPYFVKLTRCQGSASFLPFRKEQNYRCVAATEDVLNVAVINMASKRQELMSLTNHTSCKTQCGLNAADCKKPAVFRGCECVCPHHHMDCGPLKSWNKFTCRCECNASQKSCGLKRELDEKTCRCGCKKRRAFKCFAKGGRFNYENCKCIKSSNVAKSGKGKMLAENEFWICAVVGEFLILVLIFDIILYYKDHGLIYRVSSICKARKPPVNECQKEIGKDGPNGRITDEEDRYVYFSSDL